MRALLLLLLLALALSACSTTKPMECPGPPPPPPPAELSCDWNDDGVVGGPDLLLMRQHIHDCFGDEFGGS